MLRIVTDGAADVPVEWETCFGIHVLPLNVTFGEQTFTQGAGFSRAVFYRMVQEKKMIPKTSLPSIGQVKEFYRSIANQGDRILSIHISGKLSGTLSTVQTAASELAGEFQIETFDSEAGSVAQAFMAREARILDQAGANVEQILRRLEVIRARCTVLFTLNTLEYARLSGRIGVAQSLIAAALELKPIIILRAGLLELADRVRTRQRSLDRIIQTTQDRIGGRIANLAVVHAEDPATARVVFERLNSCVKSNEALIADLSIPVAAHLGPGAVGIVAYPVEED
jgi:DegV family protein with EDD domain